MFCIAQASLSLCLLRSSGMQRGVEKDQFSHVLGWLVGCSHCVEIFIFSETDVGAALLTAALWFLGPCSAIFTTTRMGDKLTFPT